MLQTEIVLPLKSEWWKKMLAKDPAKNLELRKTAPLHIIQDNLKEFMENGFKVYVYESSGSGKVVGEFTCKNIIVFSQWVLVSNSKDGFIEAEGERFYHGVSNAKIAQYEPNDNAILFGWVVSDPVKYEPPLNIEKFGLKRAPQSWCYRKKG